MSAHRTAVGGLIAYCSKSLPRWRSELFRHAGSMPATQPNPYAIAQIGIAGLPTSGLRSKNWDDFAKSGAPALDFVFTVCDNAVREACPVWPGQPMTAHWEIPDPSTVEGTEKQKEAGVPGCASFVDESHQYLCKPAP